MPKVGIPRAFSYYYFYPFFHGFLTGLGAEVVLSPRTSRRSLDLMQTCPTDEPCVSVKLCFAHTTQLLEKGIDFLFLPYMVSVDPQNYLCPKMMGLTDMLRVGLGIPDGQVLAPTVDHKDRSSTWRDTFLEVGRRLGITDAKRVEAALRAGEEGQKRFRLYCQQGMTVPEALGEKRRCRRYSPESVADAGVRIGVVGHAYILYELVGQDLVERLREHAQVVTAEMVDDSTAAQELRSVFEGEKMWHIEGHLLGAALHWLHNGLVDKLVMVQAFECGPMSVLENFIQEEADNFSVPVLNLTVDEHTGEAGLVTRLEAFLDTSPVAGGQRVTRTSAIIHTTVAPWINQMRGPEPSHLKAGVVTMGSLDVGLRAILHDCGVEVVPLPRLGKETVDLGKELAPEFICFPMVTLLGEIRHLLDRGANMILMVMGKGRCRLGWYAQVQELLLRRYGYEFEMPAFNSPVPLLTNWGPFARVVKHVAGGASWPRIVRAFRFGWRKVVLMDRGEQMVMRWRAFERERGQADRVYRRFITELDRADTHAGLDRIWSRFQEELQAIPTEETDPLHVRVVGEIYVILEPLVNKELEKMTGVQADQRVWVHRELCASDWFSLHVLGDRRLKRREEYVRKAAHPYLRELVGGHGLESVGGAVLAPQEGMDGVIHLMPFTCMPEIVAQNVLVKAADERDIPILSFIMSEQTGEAGMVTRLEAFLDLLDERRARLRRETGAWRRVGSAT